MYNFSAEGGLTEKTTTIMKKQYMKPSMEVVEIRNSAEPIFVCTSSVSGNVFDGDITGSSEPGRAPEFDEMQELIFGK